MLSPHLKLPPARLLEIGELAEISVAQRENISCSEGEYQLFRSFFQGKYELLRWKEGYGHGQLTFSPHYQGSIVLTLAICIAL